MFFTELEYRMNGGIVRLSEISIRGHLTCPKGIGPRRSFGRIPSTTYSGSIPNCPPGKTYETVRAISSYRRGPVRRRRFLCRVSIRLKETPESVLRESSVLLPPRVCPPPCSAPPHTLYGVGVEQLFCSTCSTVLRSTYTSGATRRTNGLAPIPSLGWPCLLSTWAREWGEARTPQSARVRPA
jgi:hypothetical protein